VPAVANRIDRLFESCREQKRPALILYLTSGFPDEETTRRLMPVLEEAGCDLLELGVPFSDPIADGPTIQKASTEALERGMTLARTLAIVRDLRATSQMPVILFGAYNPFLRHGLEETARDAAAAGVDGLLAADLPIEEAGPLRTALAAQGLHLVPLAAPTSPDERLRAIGEVASGFLYCIALKGITGARGAVADDVVPYLQRVRRATRVPLALGFGISTPEHVTAMKPYADAIVVGSALIATIRDARDAGRDPVEAARAYVRSLAAALR
jgi:tryptophan synthase alpha chain